MKKTIAATVLAGAMAVAMTQPSLADTRSQPRLGAEIISTQAANSSGGGWVLPLMILVMIATSIAAD